MQKNNRSLHPVGGTATAQDLVPKNNKILCSRFTPHRMTAAFTLIELSIVMVIIGLIIGGVLTGQDLINAATIRAQISQIEQYNTAVHTFKLKYNYLPGDIPAAEALANGFTGSMPRAGTVAQGDGNGVIQGIYSGSVQNGLQNGETAWFWVDLSTNSRLIDQNFNSAGVTPLVSGQAYGYGGGTPPVSQILPSAKMGKNNYISVYSQDADNSYYILSVINTIDTNGAPYNTTNSLALTPQQAYSIDSKIDDGLPQSGRVTANYIAWNIVTAQIIWASSGGVVGAALSAATPASATSCYDNGNASNTTQKYSVAYNGGTGLNCALSFKMQ